MKTKIIYRSPRGIQDRFVIATNYVGTENPQRGLELCEDLYLNQVGETEGIKISLNRKQLTAEQMRKQVYGVILRGAVSIQYDGLCNKVVTKNCKKGPWYDYVKEMNYRITQCGRTWMALTCVAVYEDIVKDSVILADQRLPEGCVVGEFVDKESNVYLMYQNVKTAEKRAVIFTLKLKDAYRSYRVNPHNGKQILLRECENMQKVMIMPGDAELIRYQNADEEAYLVEYALKK